MWRWRWTSNQDECTFILSTRDGIGVAMHKLVGAGFLLLCEADERDDFFSRIGTAGPATRPFPHLGVLIKRDTNPEGKRRDGGVDKEHGNIL